jgi:ATP-dependent Clp protease ATP-binding subunit ClpA
MAVGSAPEVAPNGYGPSMRNILRLSSQHADTLGQAEIEPEHFVLGLLDEVDGPAIGILRHFGVDVDRTRAALLHKIPGKSL